MYIEEVIEKEERLAEEVGNVADGDEEMVVSRGNVIVLTTKMALVGVGARALFYPTLVYNVVRNKVEAEFHWWDRVAQFILLGAVPFQSDVPRLKEVGVCGVITLNEPYETLVPSSLYKSYCIDHLVIATRDYCFAPSMEAISQAVDFIHRNASLGKTTYVHCKAGRGRSTTVVICYLAVLEYYHVKVLNTQSSLPDATSALIPRNMKQVCSGNVVVFDDGSMVLVTRSDVEGYDERSMNVAGNELWAAAADISMVYRVKVVGQAALARISCLWLGLRENHKLSGKNLSMGGISVDISVY
uniref:Uncharacterized protein n=1 Tax=Brassica campestris TaxID=3711 RepID=M4E2M3_BRACM